METSNKDIPTTMDSEDTPSLTKAQKKELKEAAKLEKKAIKATRKKEEKQFQKWLEEKEVAAAAEAERPRRQFETKKEPRKALATFFRNQNKMMVTAIAIADRKAMIMIRMNSLIVSVAMVSFRYLNDSITLGWLIGAILILGTGIALVFAVLAAKPNNNFLRRVEKEEIIPAYPNLEQRNFWVPANTTLQEYEASMDKVVRSQELQIGNQVRFAYMIEKRLISKYKLLDIAYTLFLGSLIVATLIFFVDAIIHNI